MEKSTLRKNQLLMEAVSASEKASIQLREFAAATLLPVVLPKRSDEDRSRYLAGLLRDAIRHKYSNQLPPKFKVCVLVYEHIYDQSRVRRFIDHDNMELKHCQDVLEAAFLVNDTSSLCCAFQCGHRGAHDSTRIWILTPDQFTEWLKNHPECWRGSTEKMQE